jgi:hypothetical protein
MQGTASWHHHWSKSLQKRNFSWGIYRLSSGITCYNDGEAAGVDALSDLLRRGRGPEPAGARLAGDERQDTHRVDTKERTEVDQTATKQKARNEEG